jgi:hypothetical protein
VKVKDGIKVRGEITAILRNELGEVVDYREMHNLIVDDGLAAIASRLNGDGSEAVYTTLALGTGTTAAAAGDTALETEITDTGLARSASTVGRETDTVTDDTATFDKTWTATGVKAVTEIGVLNNVAAGGTLMGHQVFGAITTANGYTLQMIYKIIFS